MKNSEHAIGRSIVLALTAVGLLSAGLRAGPAAAADDADLFSSKLPPNVLLIVDNSVSMFSSIYHPAYDPDVNYQPWWCSDFSGSPWNLTAGPYGSGATLRSDVDITRCGVTRRIPGLDTNHDGVDDAPLGYYANYLYWLFSSAVDAPYDIDGDGTTDGTIYSQIRSHTRAFSGCKRSGNYLPFHQDRATAARLILEEVLCQVNQTGRIRFGLATFRHSFDPNGGFVRVPIEDSTWDDDNDPLTPEVPVSYSLDGTTRTHLNHLYNAFQTFNVDSSTPLAETLFQAYTYFMDRDVADLPYGDIDKDGVPDTSAGQFPVYQYVTDPATDYGGRNVSAAAGLIAPPCPVQEWCQKNFVVIITDGEPNEDDFIPETGGSSGATAAGFGNFMNLIGNYKDNVGTNTSQCTSGDTCWYLDDIAKFMHEHDFLPNQTDFPGQQKVDVYVLGFATNTSLNQFLEDTADAGGGTFDSSGDPTELADGIIDALQDIIEKSQVFTAPTVPASRSSDGNNFYLSYFKPADKTSFWEGHLKVYELNAAGEIRDSAGNCIFRDPANPSTVQCTGGLLQVDQPGFWDAADEVPVPGSRNLYVSRYQSGPPSTIPATPQAFSEANLTAADLGVTAADIPLYANVDNGITGITTADDLKNAIVRFGRGCRFGSGACTERLRTLGDIFHSSPIPVGPPNSPIANLGYQEFARQYGTRTRVIYVGTNGGFVHGFHTGAWQTSPAPARYDRGTGQELFGFMPYPARQNARHLPNDVPPRDYYYVDGSPSVADVWFYPNETAVPGGPTDWASWHTVMIGGLRQGGEAIYALDVTNPDGVSGGPGYPGYLWEFPCEDQTDTLCTGSGTYAWADYMGETWSQPVITKIRMTPTCAGTCPAYVDRWVAIFGAGYDESSDPNEPTGAAYDATLAATTSRKGRAVFMVDIKTGKVLAVKRFDHDPTQGDPAMRYAFASAPAVFDVNYDGYADVVYIGDLGGQLWKWVIDAPAQDTIGVSATGNVSQPGWFWKRIFVATPCAVPTCTPMRTKSMFYPPTGTLLHGDLFLAFGTGERAQLDYVGTQPEERNRYYVLRDGDPTERFTPVAPAIDPDPRFTDLPMTGQVKDVSNYSGTCTPPTGSDVGFYFEGEDGEKFITESTIFAGDVLTGSFVPSNSTSGCEASGNGYLYFFDLFCGRGRFTNPSNPSPSANLPRTYVGKGPPTRPTVSMGSLENQDDGNPCDNMVFDFSSDGEGQVLRADCVPNSGVRTRSWRDLD
jgi:type IV pilus assembly protein PilY1